MQKRLSILILLKYVRKGKWQLRPWRKSWCFTRPPSRVSWVHSQGTLTAWGPFYMGLLSPGKKDRTSLLLLCFLLSIPKALLNIRIWIQLWKLLSPQTLRCPSYLVGRSAGENGVSSNHSYERFQIISAVNWKYHVRAALSITSKKKVVCLIRTYMDATRWRMQLTCLASLNLHNLFLSY